MSKVQMKFLIDSDIKDLIQSTCELRGVSMTDAFLSSLDYWVNMNQGEAMKMVKEYQEKKEIRKAEEVLRRNGIRLERPILACGHDVVGGTGKVISGEAFEKMSEEERKAFLAG
jgi:hypothetical protein